MKHKRFFPRLTSLLCTLAMSLSLVPAVSAASQPEPLISTNRYGYYNGNWAVPRSSYLYQDGQDLVRVEYRKGSQLVNGQTGQFLEWLTPTTLVVETYDSRFQLKETRELEVELPIWGGFFAGEDYNFVVFGQENPSESDSAEVVRVVKYSKSWERLDQASLRGANTTIPFDAGGFTCAEDGGLLYIRTSHEMYTSSDGLNHQASLSFTVRQEDMTISDVASAVSNPATGYVSHSFNQLMLVDQEGRLVTLDHGDAYPRGASLYRCDGQSGRRGTQLLVASWPGSIGANVTGAQVTGLAETSTGYLTAYSYTGKGASSNLTADVKNIYLAYTSKDDFSQSGTRTRQIISYANGGNIYGSQPVLVPTSLEDGYIIWSMAEKADNGYYYNTDSIGYARYSAEGSVSDLRTAEGVMASDCTPIVYNGQVVWYATDDSVPVFYVLDEDGVTAYPTAGEESEPPADPEQPERPSRPSALSDPRQAATIRQAVEQANLLSRRIVLSNPSRLAIREDGSLWDAGPGYLTEDETAQPPVKLMDGVRQICRSDNDLLLAVKEDDTLWAWGYYVGSLGLLDSFDAWSETPIKVADNVRSVATGKFGAMVVRTDGSLWYYGLVSAGEDGSGTDYGAADPDSYGPHHVMDNVVMVDAGLSRYVALKEDGSVWVWGADGYGGDGKMILYNGDAPLPLTKLLDGMTSVGMEGESGWAIDQEGGLWTWGVNDNGEVGNGMAYDTVTPWSEGVGQSTPVKIIDRDVISAERGAAVLKSGDLYTWGITEEGGDTVSSYGFHVQSFPIKTGEDTVIANTALCSDGSLHAPDGEVLIDGIFTPSGQSVQGTADQEREPSGTSTPGQTERPDQGAAPHFSDIKAGQWFQPYVEKVVQNGLMTGMGDGRFEPGGDLSIAQTLVLAYQIHSRESGDPLPQTSGGWYMPYYQYCLDNGILTARDFPQSCLNDKATRYDMVAILDQAIPDDQMEAINTVRDGDVPDLGEGDELGDVVYRWYRAGVLTGDEEGRFHGGSDITRAEVSVILCQLAGLVDRARL